MYTAYSSFRYGSLAFLWSDIHLLIWPFPAPIFCLVQSATWPWDSFYLRQEKRSQIWAHRKKIVPSINTTSRFFVKKKKRNTGGLHNQSKWDDILWPERVAIGPVNTGKTDLNVVVLKKMHYLTDNIKRNYFQQMILSTEKGIQNHKHYIHNKAISIKFHFWIFNQSILPSDLSQPTPLTASFSSSKPCPEINVQEWH